MQTPQDGDQSVAQQGPATQVAQVETLDSVTRYSHTQLLVAAAIQAIGPDMPTLMMRFVPAQEGCGSGVVLRLGGARFGVLSEELRLASDPVAMGAAIGVLLARTQRLLRTSRPSGG